VYEDGDMDQIAREFEQCKNGVLEEDTHIIMQSTLD